MGLQLVLSQKGRRSMSAPNNACSGDAARYMKVVLAWSCSRFDGESCPVLLPLKPTVGPLGNGIVIKQRVAIES